MLKSLGEKLINKDITTGFKIDLQVKNLKIAMDSDYIKKIPIFGMRLVALLYAENKLIMNVVTGIKVFSGNIISF